MIHGYILQSWENMGENDFQLAQQSKVSAQIHFLGQRSDAISFLVTSQLFILPSHRDASPRVVREAMACSVPCIVTDIPGARDLIIDGVTGLLVPPSSPQQMAASIRSLIDNPERLEAFAKASREHIIQDFSVKAYTDASPRYSGRSRKHRLFTDSETTDIANE